ncbi:ABC transporter permease [Puniceicoccus vermicola]|uniref:ABC transporter permease n=1 Tax=Puniceicoccus vermicola TaxID=388746 RepID=A0A7X1B1R4_9BACT|nr:FtsX-like permease family protein [Puniceicoccus vermicola]MBC2603957.1 ABC transporter permease [Puniceicoccus vermicola]
MSFLKLIFTNLRRHRVRGIFGVAGIAFGVAAMLTVLAVVLGAIGMFSNILESDSQYLVFERDVSDLFFSSVPASAWEEMASMPEVKGAHPVLFGIVNSPGHPVITCFGLNATNPRVRQADWIAGDPSSFGKEDQTVYLGVRASEFLHAGMGDSVEIGKGTFTVGGILKTKNGFEDGGVFFPLSLAQEYFHREGLASIVSVNLTSMDDGEAFKKRVAKAFPDLEVLASSEFNSSYSQFKILTATAWAVGLCSFLLGGMSVANTMTLSVFTRIREIAILRVCGFSRSQAAGLILGEGLVLAFFGVLLGLGSGIGLLGILHEVPQLQGYIQADVSLWMVIGISVTALLTSLGGSIYPAWFASRIQPAEALRYE